MGRRGHVRSSEAFNSFMQSVPEDLQNTGYWLIYKDKVGKTGGVIRGGCGHLPFEQGDGYDELRKKIYDAFIDRPDGHGPGDYNALPCDADKKELKGKPIVKFRFSEKEAPMREDEASDGVRDTMKMVKGMHRDMLDMNKLQFQKEFFDAMLGKKKEEDPVKDNSANGNDPMSTMMMMKFLGEGDGNSKRSEVEHLRDIFDSKLESKMSEIKMMIGQNQQPSQTTQAIERMERLIEKVVDVQTRPRDDGGVRELLQKLIEAQSAGKQENAFQTMMAMQVKEREDRERVRQEEVRRQDERDRDERKERERREKEEREARERERKEERERYETQMKFEREKLEKQVEENRRRFEEESRIRRDELKAEDEKARRHATEQQGFQLKLLDIFKNNKDSGLEMTAKVVETLTAAGMNSMRISQDAAETIMSIAKKDSGEDDGIGKTLKDIAGIAAPLLGAYAGTEKQLDQLKNLMGGGAGLQNILQNLQGAQQGAQSGGGINLQNLPPDVKAALRAVMKQQAKAGQPQQRSQAAPAGQAADAPESKGSVKPKEGSSMIAQYLAKFPILKHALIGNLQDKLGVELFVPVVTGIGEEVLEGLLANLPAPVVMSEVKQVCTEEEKKLVDANASWFNDFRKLMIEELQSDDDDEGEAEETPAAAPAAAAVPAQQPPQPQAQASPAQPAQPQ